VTITPLKTEASHRTVTLDGETTEWLERHREAQIAEKDAALGVYEDRDLLFADALGRPLNPQRVTEAFRAHRKAAGIRQGRLHDLRHSHATHLLTRGVPVHVVAARLGHSSPTITLGIYAHLLPTSDVEAAEKVGVLLAR
jgi:integrase